MEIIVILFIVLIILLSVLKMYNDFIKLKNKIKQSESGIDVYLNQRFDLIPNLVECVKSYTKYETETLDKIVELKEQNDIIKKTLKNMKKQEYEIFIMFYYEGRKINEICEILKTYDIIIPVPLNKSRKKERGYNQTELIAKEISKNIKNLKYLNILEKTKNAVPQSTLNKAQRLKNLENAYKLKKEINIQDQKILIFDDVFTTGTTANECAKIIKTIGNNKISIFTIAKD